jgi:hypothetical protein
LIPAFPLSEDDAFGSNPATGKIVYRFPPVHELLAVPEAAIAHYQSMSFIISVVSGDEDFGEITLTCKHEPNCRVTFHRSYTPVLYGLQPPVVYHLGETDVWFNPRQVPHLIRDLANDELPYINIKIDGRLVDQEGFVNYETELGQFWRNAVRAVVGNQPPGITNRLTMLWEVGDSQVQT